MPKVTIKSGITSNITYTIDVKTALLNLIAKIRYNNDSAYIYLLWQFLNLKIDMFNGNISIDHYHQ